MALSPRESKVVLGLDPGAPDPPPTTAHAAARQEIDQLDRKLNAHVASQRRPDETAESAFARVTRENPELLNAHDTEARAILKRHGVAQGAVARTVGGV